MAMHIAIYIACPTYRSAYSIAMYIGVYTDTAIAYDHIDSWHIDMYIYL